MDLWLRQGFCVFMLTSKKYTSNIFVECKIYILFNKFTILLSYIFYFILILLCYFTFYQLFPGKQGMRKSFCAKILLRGTVPGQGLGEKGK